MRRPDYVPKLCEHKPTGRAFVKLGGKQIYLGRFGSLDAKRRYDRLVADWLAGGRRTGGAGDGGREGVSLAELAGRYTASVRARTDSYRDAVERTVASMLKHAGDRPAASFGPKLLKTLAESWVQDGLAHGTVRNQMGIVKRCFRWAAGEELVSGSVWHALAAVRCPPPEHGGGRATEPVGPVPEEDVQKVLQAAKPQVAAMVQVQLLTGMRPGELTAITPAQVDRSGEVWVYRPVQHKNRWRGKVREVLVGPRAQAVLGPWLDRCERPSSPAFPGRNGRTMNAQDYWGRVRTACQNAGVEPWAPNRLRHAAGTRIRNLYGRDEAQSVLGHADGQTTERYAKVLDERALKVAREIG